MLGQPPLPPVPLSLSGRVSLIQRRFYQRFAGYGSGMDVYAVEVFDDHLVAYDYTDERYYGVDYAVGEDEHTVTFSDRKAWQEVESAWVPIAREQARAEVRMLLQEEGDVSPSFRFVEGAAPGVVTRADVATSFREARDGQRTTAWVTTDAIARDGMILEPDGLDTSAYLTNPVVLWQHGADPQRGTVPIARCVSLTRRDEGSVRGWLSTIEWATDAFAQLIREQVRTGLLSMTSIGWNSRRVENRAIGGRTVPVVMEAEMLEFSIVAIGSDRNALVVERSNDGARLSRIEAMVDELRRKLTAHGPFKEAELLAAKAGRTAPDSDATASPTPEATAPTPAPTRAATAEDYAALVAALVPSINRSVAQALGRA